MRRYGTVVVFDADNLIGAAIAMRFATEGFTVFAGAKNIENLMPLVQCIEAVGGRMFAHGLDPSKKREIAGLLEAADQEAPLEVCVFNDVFDANAPLLETTDKMFRTAWETICYTGFLTCREAARILVPRNRGAIFLMGTTGSRRGHAGHIADAAATCGLRSVVQSAARELGPKNIHVAHLIIDVATGTGSVDLAAKHHEGDAVEQELPLERMRPDAVGDSCLQLYYQPRDAWSSELVIRPAGNRW